MIRVPYGDSNFAKIIRKERYYADRTHYIEVLENYPSDYLFFLRPRKFGKSLFLSMLEYYYGIQYKNNFEELFGKLYIGQHPTVDANQYLILKFDFSQIDTSSFERAYQGFLENVKNGVTAFYDTYSDLFLPKDFEDLLRYTYPGHILQDVVLKTQARTARKIYLLIDEYDHFANEILSFRFDEFLKIVGRNGFVRKFFESIKVATQSGTIDRLFATGVSPITLDSLTSGFNIPSNITLQPQFNEMLGFSEAEVRTILRGVEVPEEELEEVVLELQLWYNGYKFSRKGEKLVYNSNMVLYFASEYSIGKQYPDDLLDINIASDYHKIRKSFKIKNKEKEHLQHLDTLLKSGRITATLVRQYNLERQFGKADFISLLFYQGIVTISDNDFDQVVFRMPNYVIKQLYFQYFHQVILEQSQAEGTAIDVRSKVIPLADRGDMQPLLKHTQSILQALAVRDKMNFDEKHIKTIFTSAFYVSNIYTIFNEFEVQRSSTGKGFVDLLLIQRPPYKPNFQFVIEFKYVKQKDARQAPAIRAKAIEQLQEYLANDTYLQGLERLKACVVIFVGNTGEVIEL